MAPMRPNRWSTPIDIPAAVAELARIVKPGGRIVIIDKNAKPGAD